jgi:hypothetical protein
MSLDEKKSQGKAVEITVNSKEENSEDFCLNFVQEFDLWKTMRCRLFIHCYGTC